MMQRRDSWAMVALLCLLSGACRASSSSAPARPIEPPTAKVELPASAKENAAVQPHSYAKPPLGELKQKLNRLQFEVTQNDATEPPFHNEFWDNHAPGIYVDIATGEPLFSSLDKFESGTGWPSFTRPIDDGHVVAKQDVSVGMLRTEVRSTVGDSHLGHVFDDGPAPTRLRYCINSASLRFIPVERLAGEGYGEYAARFAREPSASAAPASTANACAKPPPGERAGCETTLETALLGGGRKARDALRALAGVLEVEAGAVDHADAVRVVFDPKQIAYADLLATWEPIEGGASHLVYCTSDAQRRVAEEYRTRSLRGAGAKGSIVVRAADANAFVASSK